MVKMRPIPRPDDCADREDDDVLEDGGQRDTTAPIAGKVSSPENGGAKKAAIANAISSSPSSRSIQRRQQPSPTGARDPLDALDPADDEWDRLARDSVAELALLPALGEPVVPRPSTICAASKTVITSKTWVTPPVGSGIAGTIIRSMIVTAKLFSANTPPIPPSVLGSSLASQRSSSSLNRGTLCAVDATITRSISRV